MSLQGLLSEVATVYIPDFDAVDAYGDIQPGTETATTYPARFEQLDSDETLRDRDTIVGRWRVFLPAGAVVNGFARVVDQDGRHFEVQGDPVERRAPRGVHHLQVPLKRVT